MVALGSTSACSRDRPRVSSLQGGPGQRSGSPCLSSGPAYGQRTPPWAPRASLEAGPDGRHMPVHAARGAPDAQGQSTLQEAAEDLHLVGAAVLGDLEPLHQELGGDTLPVGPAGGQVGSARQGVGVWGRGGPAPPPPGGASSTWSPGVAPQPRGRVGGAWGARTSIQM